MSAAAPQHSPAQALRLFLLGFLTLFLELALIRYLAGNVWNLGYFPNLVLMAVFVGMGVGFTFHHRLSEQASRRLFPASSALLLGLAAVVTFAHPNVPGFGAVEAELGGELFFTATSGRGGPGNALLFALWFLASVAVFAIIAQRTAKVFRCFRPLTAYTLDIAGSCCGILAFGAMSWFAWPPQAWFALVAALFVLSAEPPRSGLLLVPIASLAGAAALSAYQDTRLLADPEHRGAVTVTWSPYQKVEYAVTADGWRRIYVNGIGHQNMWPVEALKQASLGVPYARPYRLRARRPQLPPYRRVLVLGAGSGNDVAAALLSGAEHVDAVEIDPAIAAIGRQHHPARPYDDPRVSLTIDDGRAFLTRARGPYDLIVFALTDSLVKVSPMAQLRLENYLFTEESIARARRLLSDDGDLVFYNFYRQPWLAQKIEAMIARATGQAPARIYERASFVMMAAGRHNRGETPDAAGIATATDDWPFLYLRDRGIPGLYLAVMAGLGALLLGLMSALQRSSRHDPRLGQAPGAATKAAFALMGVAFLLLETKSVIQFSLLFGTTWVNNSLVFLAVLLLVLAANWAAVYLSAARLGSIYALLLGSCLVTLVFPLSRLLAIESWGWRFVFAAALTFSPIFFANLIFSLVFRDQPVAEHLFGWNLLGATLGGMVEYSSLAVGYNNLALIVAACYTVAFALLLRARAEAGRSASRADAPAPLVDPR